MAPELGVEEAGRIAISIRDEVSSNRTHRTQSYPIVPTTRPHDEEARMRPMLSHGGDKHKLTWKRPG